MKFNNKHKCSLMHERENINLINAAVALDNISIHHLVQFTPLQARRFASLAEPHGVTGRHLRWIIRQVDRRIPPMDYGKDNPNTGYPHHWYEIGKELSRVLYLHVVNCYLPDDFDYIGFTKRIKELTFSADESWEIIPGITHYVYRVWWD